VNVGAGFEEVSFGFRGARAEAIELICMARCRANVALRPTAGVQPDSVRAIA
jgi:hypothetical protein